MKFYTHPGWARLRCPAASAENPGHLADVEFIWKAGSEHADHHQPELTCQCGQLLVFESGTNPWAAEHIEVKGTPHKP